MTRMHANPSKRITSLAEAATSHRPNSLKWMESDGEMLLRGEIHATEQKSSEDMARTNRTSMSLHEFSISCFPFQEQTYRSCQSSPEQPGKGLLLSGVWPYKRKHRRTDSENQFHKKQTLVCAAHKKSHPCQSAGQVLLCKAILITCSWEKKCDFSCLPQLQAVNKALMQA